MIRKVVSITLLFIGLAFAVAGQTAEYTYTTNNGGITITGYTGSGGDITVPGAIESLPVTGIGTNAFSEYSRSPVLTGVTIPEGVTDIGDFAFYQCTRLAYITIPGSVTNIGRYAINGCASLAHVEVPGSVAGIGKYAFYNCTNLNAITVDATNSFYSSIDGVLFNKSQTSLIQYPAGKPGSSYTIPSGVTGIGSHAFSRCSGMTSLIVPGSVTNIESQICNYSGVRTITVDPLNAYYSSADGVLFDKAQTVLILYPPQKTGSYTVPAGVTDIGSQAFYAGSAGSITFPNSVTRIGEQAFYNCSGLQQLLFQGNAPGFGLSVFSASDTATNYYLPDTTGWDTVFSGRPAVLWNPDYLLTINGGSGSGSYTNRQQVMITANDPSLGKIFDQWVGATQYVADTRSPATTVTMPVPADFTLPTADVILTATYNDLCTLIVEAAHGAAVFPSGTNVYIWGTAVTCSVENVTSDGWMFTGWTGDVSTDYTATNTVVVMDALSKSITAQYSDDADSDGILNTSELTLGTNPRMKDTDGDGFDDGLEVAQEMNPLKDNSAVRSYIESNPETFGLYASNAVLDVAVGEVLLDTQNGQARLRLQMERSDDLQSWTNAGDAVDWALPLDGNKKFFRIKAFK